MTTMTADERNELEALIDRRGLPEVVGALADICGEKSEHIRANWQDPKMGRRWADASKRLACVADAVTRG